MGAGDDQSELAALRAEWHATYNPLTERRFLGRVIGAEKHRRKGRRRALARHAIGLLDFDAAATGLGLSQDELCSHAFGSRIAPDDVRRICARFEDGSEQLVAAAVAAELNIRRSLVRKLAKVLRPRRAGPTGDRREAPELRTRRTA